MNMFRRFTLCALLLVAAALVPSAPRAAAAPAAGDDLPAWLKAAATSAAPSYDRDVPGVVLNHERTITVGEDGRITTVTTYAVRMLTRAGFDRAVAAARYDTDNGGKVLDL